MTENALDTLSLALALSGAGMPRPQAEALACAAGRAVAGSGRNRPDFFDALYSAGLAPTLAEVLATLLAKHDLPMAGAIVDTFSPYRKLEAAGVSPAQAGIILEFLYERQPARRRAAVFSTAHTVRDLLGGGLSQAAAEALTRLLLQAHQGKTPDTLTVAHAIAASGLAVPQAEAIARYLFLVLDRSDSSNLSDLLTAGLPANGAFALRDIFFQAMAAGVIIDTLGIADILRRAGLRPGVVSAYADIGRDVAATAVGAVIGTLSVARKFEAAGVPFQLAVVIAGTLYRLRNWDFHSIPHVEVITAMLEASGFDPDDARGFAAALKALAVWRPA